MHLAVSRLTEAIAGPPWRSGALGLPFSIWKNSEKDSSTHTNCDDDSDRPKQAGRDWASQCRIRAGRKPSIDDIRDDGGDDTGRENGDDRAQRSDESRERLVRSSPCRPRP